MFSQLLEQLQSRNINWIGIARAAIAKATGGAARATEGSAT